MSFEQLQYEKSWMNAADFATRETSESRVRSDLQYFPDVIRAYINETLIPAITDELEALVMGTVPDGSLSRAKLNEEAADALIGSAEAITLKVDEWDYAKCYVIFSDGIKDENTVIDMFVSPDATAAQRTALQEAELVWRSQTDGSVTLLAKGIKPTEDLPVVLYFRQDIAASEGEVKSHFINHIASPGQKFIVWDGLGDAPAVVNGAIMLKVAR